MKLSEIFSKIKGKTEDAELLSAINELFNTSQRDYSRLMMERVWYRNILYYLGEQYIEYVKSLRSFRRRILPDYIPTPVSNEIREFVRSVKATFINQKMVVSVAPNTSEYEDIRAAELGKILLEWMDNYNEGEIKDEEEKVALASVLFGVGFMRTFPLMENDTWVFDKSGNIITQGDVGNENVIPFNVFTDSLGDRLNKKRWIGIQSLKPKEWVEDTFKVKISSANEYLATDYNKRLMKMVGQVSPWKSAGIDSQDFNLDDDSLVLFRELEMRPTVKYPEGRYIISCGDKICQKYDRMPIKTENGKWFYSLTDFPYDYLPGTFWPDAGVNNLISPQNTINEIDQALSINRKSVARPRIVTPGEIGLKKVDTVGGLGVGLLMMQYDPLLSGGKEPVIHDGTPLPQQVLAERDIQRRVIQDVGGDPKNIMRGEAPGSRASGIMVDILRETAEKGRYPDLDRYTRAKTRVYKKRLILAQEIMTEERMLKIAGKGNQWKIIKFKAADLRNNTDVRLELDSGLASTNAGKMNILMDFAQRGILGNVAENSELKQELLRRAGLSGFTEQENPDVKRAEMENSFIESGNVENIMVAEIDPKTGAVSPDSETPNIDPFFKYDNHQIHYEVHRRCIMSPAFAEWDAKSQRIMIAHTDIHHMLAEQERKNQVPPHDPREFMQMDKLYPLLARSEQEQVLAELKIKPEKNPKTVGIPTTTDMIKFKVEQEKTKKEKEDDTDEKHGSAA